ncbi:MULTISPECIES: hypothetical protein [Streptomycetaceae]|uniref:Uncharacterized protein n=1 Tax=Streptantibioticus cattleyicolor (strain ATCC 35852 / DSM 46488 / JCM 4925 / NBRC 14057 / NRRL 8057) TaxID=1003195 RepID=F8JWY4_STREN|nr:hypothetical protein [Streptantibioticus cattleyicolor]AEW93255.1 hypothetical protein SCATT_08840 [Streptantibioticus cattleyicolor NRRL 8057 = DSM 46488]MYS57976.1 hypothetical protein [Streptomyces sp. SID5468]CCB73615.1 conserved exported protein of unknown function [Streptantibioticus cattleyicolor NRRL 8057 = DSM 46488]
MFRTVLRTCAAVAAAGALACAAPAATAAPRAGQGSPQYTAAEVHRFLTGFYGQHGPSAYRRIHQVTPELRRRAAGTTGYDLLLCAQNTPRGIGVGEVTTAASAGQGWATVTTRWSGGARRSFTAYVGLDRRQPLRLSGIDCRP